MNNIDRDFGHLGDVGERITYITTTADNEARKLKPYEQNVVIDAGAGDSDIELPDLAEAAGKFYSFILVDSGSGTYDVDFTAPDSSASVATALTAVDLDADGDRCLFYCDGYSWWVVNTVIA